MDLNSLDEQKQWENFKAWLYIQSNADSNVDKTSEQKFTLIFKAIGKLGQDWFTRDNLSELLTKIKNCGMNFVADDMKSILTVFKKKNPDLKFNNLGKQIFEQTDSLFGLYSDDRFSNFEMLLSFGYLGDKYFFGTHL